MNYIEKIFARADIQQICEFLINGCEGLETDSHSYIERVERPLEKLNQRVHELYSTEEEYEKMMAIIFEYSTAVERVYLETGLQAGARLCVQIYRNFKNALEG